MKRLLMLLMVLVVMLTSNICFAEKYVVEFQMSQSHFTLDIMEHIEDAANAVTFQIPVDKDYF